LDSFAAPDASNMGEMMGLFSGELDYIVWTEGRDVESL
jgi:hypothetical protein